jgi:hypothetical protein
MRIKQAVRTDTAARQSPVYSLLCRFLIDQAPALCPGTFHAAACLIPE